MKSTLTLNSASRERGISLNESLSIMLIGVILFVMSMITIAYIIEGVGQIDNLRTTNKEIQVETRLRPAPSRSFIIPPTSREPGNDIELNSQLMVTATSASSEECARIIIHSSNFNPSNMKDLKFCFESGYIIMSFPDEATYEEFKRTLPPAEPNAPPETP